MEKEKLEIYKSQINKCAITVGPVNSSSVDAKQGDEKSEEIKQYIYKALVVHDNLDGV